MVAKREGFSFYFPVGTSIIISKVRAFIFRLMGRGEK